MNRLCGRSRQRSGAALLLVTAACLNGCGAPSSDNTVDEKASAEVTAGEQPKVNDTGVTAYIIDETYTDDTAPPNTYSKNGAANNQSDFPTNQDAAFGDDVDHPDNSNGAAGLRFLRLDENGAALSGSSGDYGASPWSCVKDQHTGLTWEVKTDPKDLNNPRRFIASYSWYDTNPNTNGGDEGLPDGGNCGNEIRCDTEAYVEYINQLNDGAGLCGVNNWRLPTREEVRSIVDYSITDGLMLDSRFFPNGSSKEEEIWTSQTDVSDITRAWTVHISLNGHQVHEKDLPNSVMLVSSDRQ